jgi:hypothetical protein
MRRQAVIEAALAPELFADEEKPAAPPQPTQDAVWQAQEAALPLLPPAEHVALEDASVPPVPSVGEDADATQPMAEATASAELLAAEEALMALEPPVGDDHEQALEAALAAPQAPPPAEVHDAEAEAAEEEAAAAAADAAASLRAISPDEHAHPPVAQQTEPTVELAAAPPMVVPEETPYGAYGDPGTVAQDACMFGAPFPAAAPAWLLSLRNCGWTKLCR